MALQNLCIDIIISNFEQYFSKFSNTEDPGLKQRFEYLQRKFSYKMATTLYKESRMKTEYIDFLINKHLKVLEFKWLKKCSWDKIVAKFKEVGPDLRNVCFSGGRRKPMQDLMPYLPNLEVMTYHRYCTNGLLEGLAEFCDNILEIDICTSDSVTDEGIKQLCFKENGEKSCVKLRKLVVGSTGVTREGVIYILKHMPSIETMGFGRIPEVLYSMHKNDLPLIKNIKPYNLQNLDLSHCSGRRGFTNLLKICVSVCPHLKSLSCIVEEQEHVNILSELSELENLDLNNTFGTGIQINEMLELNGKKLSTLAVSSLPLSVLSLSNSCPVLKYLNLFDLSFTKDNGMSSCVFPCLETCILVDNVALIDNGESHSESIGLLLQSSPRLNHVAFIRFILSNEIKLEILKCCEQKPIKKINFSSSKVEIDFIRDILLNCHSLTSITLYDCGLSKEEKIQLVKIAQLLPNNPKLHFKNHREDDLNISFGFPIDDYESDQYSYNLEDDSDYDDSDEYNNSYDDSDEYNNSYDDSDEYNNSYDDSDVEGPLFKRLRLHYG